MGWAGVDSSSSSSPACKWYWPSTKAGKTGMRSHMPEDSSSPSSPASSTPYPGTNLSKILSNMANLLGFQRLVYDRLGLFLYLFQMICSAEALRIDLVDILRSRWPCGKPPV